MLTLGLSIGLNTSRAVTQSGGGGHTIVNGSGVTGTPSITLAGGTNWTVASTGSVPGPWTVTTAQLASGIPILLEEQTVTTAAGPIFSVTSGGNDPIFLSPSSDPVEFTYEWRVNGSLVGSGRTYDATDDTGLLVESVVTAFNGATGDFVGVASVVVAQAAATEVGPVQFTDQKLTDATTASSGGGRFFVVTFSTPAVMAAARLWHGHTGAFDSPYLRYGADGLIQSLIGVLQSSASGALVASTKYTIFVSEGPTMRQLLLQQGATVTTIQNTTANTPAPSITFNTIGQRYDGATQFTGALYRMITGPHQVNFAEASFRQQFVDATGTVVLPSVGQAAVASFDFDFYDKARMEAGTNGGTFGNFTKTGSAFP